MNAELGSTFRGHRLSCVLCDTSHVVLFSLLQRKPTKCEGSHVTEHLHTAFVLLSSLRLVNSGSCIVSCVCSAALGLGSTQPVVCIFAKIRQSCRPRCWPPWKTLCCFPVTTVTLLVTWFTDGMLENNTIPVCRCLVVWLFSYFAGFLTRKKGYVRRIAQETAQSLASGGALQPCIRTSGLEPIIKPINIINELRGK